MLLWQAWKAYAHRAGGYQTRALLGAVYLVVLGPAALVGRLFSARLLDLSHVPGKGTWLTRGPQEATLDALRRQF
jgi:hypothetical protein